MHYSPYQNQTGTMTGFSGSTLILTALLALVIGMILGYVWAGDSFADERAAVTNTVQNPVATVNTALTSDHTEATAMDASEANEPAFTIVVANLPTAQQDALRMMGFSEAEIVITKGTMACAETKITNERTVEIQNGATPSASESIALVGCYTSNQ